MKTELTSQDRQTLSGLFETFSKVNGAKPKELSFETAQKLAVDLVATVMRLEPSWFEVNRQEIETAQAEQRAAEGARAAVPEDFNGFVVEFWSHETHRVETNVFPDAESVFARKFGLNGEAFPDAEEFAENLYEVFGDTVGRITDNNGTVLLDKREEMIEAAKLY